LNFRNFGSRKKNYRSQNCIGNITDLNKILSSSEEKYLHRPNRCQCKEIIRILKIKEKIEKFYKPIQDIQKFHAFKITKEGINTKNYSFDENWSENVLFFDNSKIEEIKKINFEMYEQKNFDEKIINNCSLFSSKFEDELSKNFFKNILENTFRNEKHQFIHDKIKILDFGKEINFQVDLTLDGNYKRKQNEDNNINNNGSQSKIFKKIENNELNLCKRSSTKFNIIKEGNIQERKRKRNLIKKKNNKKKKT
jgi:hypothetical protein